MISASHREAVSRARRRMEEAGLPEPAATAETLMAELLGVGRAELALSHAHLTSEQERVYEAWISERLRGRPVQRILGYAYFRYLKLELDESTLIPRADTESVVEAALERIDARGGEAVVLDLGTGAGPIALSIALERPGCEVHASDVSREALRIACHNATAAGVEVECHLSDVASELGDLEGRLDLLVSNPPYVPAGELPTLMTEVREWDPHYALDGGPDGLLYYRRILSEARSLLRPGGELVLEVGDGTAETVSGLGRDHGYLPIGVRTDLTGSARAVILGQKG